MKRSDSEPNGEGKGPGPASRISRKQILAAARAHFVEGRKQSDIAREMGISPSYLARRLADAKKEGLVKIHIAADRDDELAAKLRAVFPSVTRVEVVPGALEDDPLALMASATSGGGRVLFESLAKERTASDVAGAVAAIVDELLDGNPRLNIAIGGGKVHRYVVDQLQPRKAAVRVAPTALTPYRPTTARFTASLVASLLAHRLGVLDGELGPESVRGELCDLSLSAPYDDKKSFRKWWRSLQDDQDYQHVARFWEQADVVLIGVRPIADVYDDVKERVGRLGRPFSALAREAVGVCANQFFDEAGSVVPLGADLPTYEPAIALSTLRGLAKRGSSGTAVILDVYGREDGSAAVPLVRHGVCNVLVCDRSAAVALLASVK